MTDPDIREWGKKEKSNSVDRNGRDKFKTVGNSGTETDLQSKIHPQ